MMSRSALKIVSICILVSSLIDVEAIVSHRKTRGTARILGIGAHHGRVDRGKGGKGKGKSGSKGGTQGRADGYSKGGKGGGKSKGNNGEKLENRLEPSSDSASDDSTRSPTPLPTTLPTPKPVGRVTVPEERPTVPPIPEVQPTFTDPNGRPSFWFPQSPPSESNMEEEGNTEPTGDSNLESTQGRFDEPNTDDSNENNNENSQVIEVVEGGISNQSENDTGGEVSDSTGTTEDEDDRSEAFQDFFGDGTTSIEVEIGDGISNEGEDDDVEERPLVEVEVDIGGNNGGSSIGGGVSIGNSGNSEGSSTENTNTGGAESTPNADGIGEGEGDTSSNSGSANFGPGGLDGFETPGENIDANSGTGGSNGSETSTGNGGANPGSGGSNGSGTSTGNGGSNGSETSAGNGGSNGSETSTVNGGSNGSGTSAENGGANSGSGGSNGSGTSTGNGGANSGNGGSNGSETSTGNGGANPGSGGSNGSGTSAGNGGSNSESGGSNGSETSTGNEGANSGTGGSNGSETPNNTGGVNVSDENGIGSDEENSTEGTNNANNEGDSQEVVDNDTDEWTPITDMNPSINEIGLEDELVSDTSTAVFCPEISSDKEVLINWIYAVEFLPELTTEEKSEALTIMELKLVSELLECNQAVLPGKRFVRHRNLFEDSIAGLNYMPLDAKNDDVVCFFSNSTDGGVCETYFGRMEMYLQKDTDDEIAINNMLYAIRDTMQRSDFPAVDGIIQVWYLDPKLGGDVSGISDAGEIIQDNNPPVDNSFSTGTMIAFAALGLFVFAAVVLGAFRIRSNDNDGITAFDQSTIMGSGMTSTNEQKSTFSAILPKSYQLDGIPEAESDSDSRYNCSVIVSDGGFTSDGDSQDDPLFPMHFDHVLGANKMEEDDIKTDNDLLFDTASPDSFSNHRKRNLVTGSEVGLGVKHSTVDVHQCTSARCKICNYRPKDVEFIHKSPTTPDVSEGNFFPDDEASEETC